MQIDQFKLEKWINDRSDKALFDLSNTCIQAFSIEELFKICGCNFDEISQKPLNYGDLHGSMKLKQAICSLYVSQTPENITVTLGGIGANQLVIESVVEKNDRVVCVAPCYQQNFSLSEFYGARAEYFFLDPKNWDFDIEKFKKFVGKDTKLICINSPNNPTGLNFDLNAIVKIAEEIDAYVLCDEVYRGLNHCGDFYSKSVTDLYSKGISTGSMSKAYSLAGIRVGWIAANRDLIDKINLNREYNTISISILDDYIATVALMNHEKIIKRNLEIISENKKLVLDFVTKFDKLSLKTPNAGSICAIKYDYKINSRDLCSDIFEKTGVLLIPACVFEQDGFFRLGYGMEKAYLSEALGLLSEYFRKICQ